MTVMRICRECGFPITDNLRIVRQQTVCCCEKPKEGICAVLSVVTTIDGTMQDGYYEKVKGDTPIIRAVTPTQTKRLTVSGTKHK